jgi:sec-independent protein translocase protein TatA
MGFLQDFGLPELLIILVIIVILFGPGRLANLAGEMGKGIRSFRQGFKGESAQQKDDEAQSDASPDENCK